VGGLSSPSSSNFPLQAVDVFILKPNSQGALVGGLQHKSWYIYVSLKVSVHFIHVISVLEHILISDLSGLVEDYNTTIKTIVNCQSKWKGALSDSL